MRPADREVLEEVLVATEEHVIEIIRAAVAPVGMGSTSGSRQRTRDRLVDAVEELISHSELSK